MDYYTIKTHLEDSGYEVLSYSGRGMYGCKCLGVIIDHPMETIRLGLNLGLLISDDTDDSPEISGELYDIIESARYDNFGHKYVVYFPSLNFEE